MDPRFLEEVVGTLFSGATDEENNRFTNEEEESRDPARSWSPESRVTKEELAEAIGRIGAQSPVQGSGPRRSHDPPVEGHRRGFGPEINASIWQMPVSGRIPCLVERGTNGLAAEAGTLSGLTVCLSTGVPFVQGW